MPAYALPQERGTIMIPQEQKDKVQHGEQARSPAGEQHSPLYTSPRPVRARYLSMVFLLSIGLYGAALGEAFLVALMLWPNAMQDNAFMTIGFLAMFMILMGSLLLLGSLISAQVHWLMTIGVFFLSLLAAFAQGWLFPSYQNIVSWCLTYGALAILLSLILLCLAKGIWSVLWRTLLVTVAGLATVIAVLVARGPDDWKYPPDGLDILLVTLVVGALILIVEYLFIRKSKKTNQHAST